MYSTITNTFHWQHRVAKKHSTLMHLYSTLTASKTPLIGLNPQSAKSLQILPITKTGKSSPPAPLRSTDVETIESNQKRGDRRRPEISHVERKKANTRKVFSKEGKKIRHRRFVSRNPRLKKRLSRKFAEYPENQRRQWGKQGMLGGDPRDFIIVSYLPYSVSFSYYKSLRELSPARRSTRQYVNV